MQKYNKKPVSNTRYVKSTAEIAETMPTSTTEMSCNEFISKMAIEFKDFSFNASNGDCVIHGVCENGKIKIVKKIDVAGEKLKLKKFLKDGHGN